MKKILKPFLIFLLVFFSFFYTDKIMNIINEKDPLMVTIKELEENYRVEAVNAVITDNTIIPGIKGKEVDLDKSYEKMKLDGIFREESIIFKDIYPSGSLDDNKDKYIIKGNSSKNQVAIVYIIDDDNDLEEIKNIKEMSLFISSKYLKMEVLNHIDSKEIYTYGNNGKYTKDNILSDNALIFHIVGNAPKYCLAKEKNDDILNLCQKHDMMTIIPNIIGDYFEVKTKLSPGSIILLNRIDNYDLIKKYINSKGYDIIGLSKLLEE